MARSKKPVTRVHIRVTHAFNDLYKGDEAEVELNATVQGWINSGVVRLLAEVNTSGENTARPERSTANRAGRKPTRADRGRSASSQPGEDPRAS